MCGRFTLHRSTKEVAARFGVQKVLFEAEARYNIAPTQQVATITQQNGERVLDGFRWGLVPFWADDPGIGNRMFNARSETLREKPAFKRILQRKRCLIPADGFYEWREDENSGAKKSRASKTPLHIKRKDGELFAFAGLWDEWQPKAQAGSTPDADAEPLRTCTIITSAPNEFLSRVHHRMAVILPTEFEEAWLDPTLDDADELLQILAPRESEELEMYPVSASVNKPAFDDASCIAPAAEEPAAQKTAEQKPLW
jgi:putative SOS response-associated peptidase YedK